MKTISISQWVMAVVIIVFGTLATFAAPVVNVGTLPIGKSVTIVFQTTINNSVPNGTTQISSSGTVSGNNFSSVTAGPAVTPLFIAPIITSATNTTFTVGNSGVFNVTKTGSPVPDMSVSGTFPNGVSFNPGTGNLAGTPAVGTGGLYPLVFTATNAAGTNTQNFTLTVNQHPAFTNVSSTTFIAGSLGTFKIGASGFPAPTLSETNTDVLPGGVSFTDNGNGTATLSGTPAGGSGGTYTLHFFATNGVSSDANQTFTLTVNEAPAFTSSNNTTFISGSANSFNVTARGFPAPGFSASAPLPGGLTLTTGGLLSGTPLSGVYHLTLLATNAIGTNGQPFTLTVNEAPVITASNTTFTVSSNGTYTITTTGFPTPALSESNTDVLPGGVTFAPATGVLSGTPTVGSGGLYMLHFIATNVAGTATKIFPLTVNESPAITSVTNTIFTIGSAGTFTVTTTGFPAPALNESGALPTGVTFVPATGILSGTPAIGTGGTNHLTLTATNIVGTNTQSFSLVINRPPVAGSDTLGTKENQSVNVMAAKLLANDTDADGDTLSVTAVSATSTNGGTVSLSGSTITYAPTNNYIGQDQFTYTISDGRGGTNVGIVSVTIESTNAPSQNNISITVTADSRIVKFAGIPGQDYVIQSADFANGPWTDLSGDIAAGPTGVIEYEDTTSPVPPQRYYRTRVGP